METVILWGKSPSARSSTASSIVMTVSCDCTCALDELQAAAHVVADSEPAPLFIPTWPLVIPTSHEWMQILRLGCYYSK